MLPGVIGTLEAIETIKILLGIGNPLVGRLVLYDALEQRFTEVEVPRDAGCPVCGDEAGPVEFVEYDEVCAVPA